MGYIVPVISNVEFLEIIFKHCKHIDIKLIAWEWM
jgi:hypothetical protein